MVVKLGQGIVFRPGTAFDERWAPHQYLSGFVTSIFGDDASIVVFPDAYSPFYETRVKRDDALSQDRTWTPAVGESQTMPEAPSDGVIYGRRNQAWTPVTGTGQGNISAIVISDTQPPQAIVGMAWFDTTINNFYVFEQGKWIEPGHVNPIEEVSINIIPPFISGNVALDALLSCTTGDWSSMPIAYSYQWMRGASIIPGATSNTHIIVTADLGTDVTCVVRAQNAIGISQPATSNIITIGPPVNIDPPVITGTIAVGATFTSSIGRWTNEPIINYSYQWMRNGSPLVAQTGATYIIVAGDVGSDITCEITAVNQIGASQPKASNSIGIKAPVNTALPVISGTIGVGQVFLVTNGTWTNVPTSYTYQWRADASPIAGATANSYTIVSGDVGKGITCQVTAINAVGSSSPATSDEIAILPPTIHSTPLISGIAFVGGVLTCSTGTWNQAPHGFLYQWKRGGVDLPGQTTNTYAVVIADIGTNITCVVSAINLIGTSIPQSTPTVLIASPTTLNGTSAFVTLSNGNKTVTATKTANPPTVPNSYDSGVRSNSLKNSGKWYFEVTLTDLDGTNDGCGIITQGGSFNTILDSFVGVVLFRDGTVYYSTGNFTGIDFTAGTTFIADGAVIQWCIDLDTDQFWVRLPAANWNNDSLANPATNVGGKSIAQYASTSLAPFACFGGSGAQAGDNMTFNFGASAFVNTVPAGFLAGWSI